MQIDFWGLEGSETLHTSDKDEAIQEALEQDFEFLPFTLEICGFNRMKPYLSEATRENLLENIYEVLDETFGGPDGETTRAPKEIEEAFKSFVDLLLSKYQSWACEVVTKEKVDVKKWVENHCPEWITDGVKFKDYSAL